MRRGPWLMGYVTSRTRDTVQPQIWSSIHARNNTKINNNIVGPIRLLSKSPSSSSASAAKGTTNSAPAAATTTVFFDGACPLCSREISVYQRMISQHRITDLAFIDISKHENANALATINVTLQDALAVLHCIDKNGVLHKGTPAFAAMWDRLPYWHWLGRIVSLPGVSNIVEAGYLVWAKNRTRVTGMSGKEGSNAASPAGPGASCRDPSSTSK